MKHIVIFVIILFSLLSPNTIQAANQAEFVCNQAGPLKTECCTCVAGNTECTTTGDDQVLGAWTAVGCIQQTNQQGISTFFVSILVSIAGGSALLLLLYGAFLTTTSASNPERLQNGRQIYTQAIAGLVLTLLSVIILQFIGVEILHIPGFGN